MDFNESGIGKLPNDKPALYRSKDYVPGAKVQIEQMKSIEQVTQTEARVIARSKPKYNEQGK